MVSHAHVRQLTAMSDKSVETLGSYICFLRLGKIFHSFAQNNVDFSFS